jgi:fructose-bisphosphate aldolase, class II
VHASTVGLVTDADHERRCVGAFNVIHLETAEALALAAEDAGRPLIMQISENCVDYHGRLAPLAAGVCSIARTSAVPIAVHLDHATRIDLIYEAIDLGFDSVMFDGAALDYSANVDATRQVVERAHAYGAGVEAELGEIGGKAGVHAPGVRTDPHEAAAFVAATGVDTLAVAVGSEHAMTERTARVDLGLVERLRSAAGVPLVLHGASGVSDAGMLEVARAGIAKINISTHLNGSFTSAVRRTLIERPALTDSRVYVSAGRRAVESETSRLLALFDSLQPLAR